MEILSSRPMRNTAERIAPSPMRMTSQWYIDGESLLGTLSKPIQATNAERDDVVLFSIFGP